MCGIASILLNLSAPPDLDVALRKMTDSQEHRGPDAQGQKVFSKGNLHVGLGHRRLSIIDLAGGIQPMANEDQSIWVSYNGEIYNHRELRQELVSRGHKYHTDSDTETIVHAYEDYAQVINSGDPHDYGFLRGIGGFWSSLCTLSRNAVAHGDIDWGTKQMVYVIGVSFTAELLLKAAYEETVGRLFASVRGAERAPLDLVSAAQATAYAGFLQQVPWYKWRFREDAEELYIPQGVVPQTELYFS